MCNHHILMVLFTLWYLLGKFSCSLKTIVVNWIALLIQSVYIDVLEAHMKTNKKMTCSSSVNWKLPQWPASHNYHSLRSASSKRLHLSPTSYLSNFLTWPKDVTEQTKTPNHLSKDRIGFLRFHVRCAVYQIQADVLLCIRKLEEALHFLCGTFISIFTGQKSSSLGSAAESTSYSTSTVMVLSL